MAKRGFLEPYRILFLLAVAGALAGGFFLANTVLGGYSSDEPKLSIPLDPPPPEFVQLAPTDPEFATFATDFQDFPLYWLGEEYDGYPLHAIVRHVFSPEGDSMAKNEVALFYGDCHEDHPASESCSPPMQITVQPYCLVPPELVGNGSWPTNMVKIRGGADAVKSGGGLRIWTGDITIKVYAATDQIEEAVAEALVSSNGLGPAGAGDSLPEPNPDCSGYRTVPLHRG